MTIRVAVFDAVGRCVAAADWQGDLEALTRYADATVPAGGVLARVWVPAEDVEAWLASTHLGRVDLHHCPGGQVEWVGLVWDDPGPAAAGRLTPLARRRARMPRCFTRGWRLWYRRPAEGGPLEENTRSGWRTAVVPPLPLTVRQARHRRTVSVPEGRR